MLRPWMLALALVTGFTAVQAASPALAKSEARAKLAPISKAHDFALKRSADGKAIKLSDMKGKVRLVDFWATWCPPCREEIPGFISLQKKYQAKGLEIIGVSVDRGGPAVVNSFVKENGINYTSLMSDAATESAYGGIRSIPTTFLVDREGNIVKKYLGARPTEEFEADIKALL